MHRLFAGGVVIAFGATAYATISASHYLWESGTLPNLGAPFYSIRIEVEVTSTPESADEDDWTAAGLDAELDGGVFFQHELGANPPCTIFFCLWPDLVYDSYYSSPGDYPSDEYHGDIVGIATSTDTVTQLDTDWFDTQDTGNGEFVIAQMTVIPYRPDWSLTGLLQYSAMDTGGQLFDYAFTIPEPGTAMLLMLAGTALLTRRR